MKKKDIINIFNSLGFSISYDKVLGDLIEMPAEDAFTFASITGAPYLISEHGIGVKGRSEVFIHRSVFQNEYYIYSPGLFTRDLSGNLEEGNSARCLRNKYPQIFSGRKFVYIKDIAANDSSNVERVIYEDLIHYKKETKDFILMKNFESGSAGEPFLEYLASVNFINCGYIVENQVPWFQQAFKYRGTVINGGIPDFSAFKSSIMGYLAAIGAISDKSGLSVTLLPVLINFRKLINKNLSQIRKVCYELVLGEAKIASSSLPSALKQLRQYKQVNLANELYTIIPDVKDNGDSEIGEIFIESNTLKIKKSRTPLLVDKTHSVMDTRWCNNYIKTLLLGNISFEKIMDIIRDYRVRSGQKILAKYEAHHLLDFVINIPDDEYFDIFLRNL